MSVQACQPLLHTLDMISRLLLMWPSKVPSTSLKRGRPSLPLPVKQQHKKAKPARIMAGTRGDVDELLCSVCGFRFETPDLFSEHASLHDGVNHHVFFLCRKCPDVICSSVDAIFMHCNGVHPE